MEQRIMQALDSLDLEETDRLFAEGRALEDVKELAALDKAAVQRIKASVFEQIGMHSKEITGSEESKCKTGQGKTIKGSGLTKAAYRPVPRRLAAIAAAAVIVLGTIFVLDAGNVSRAFQKLFSFIPGYGIVENNSSIEYVLDGQNIKAENKDVTIYVRNAVATGTDITVFIELYRKNFDEAELAEQKQKESEKLQKGGSLKQPDIVLFSGNKPYKSEGMTIGGGGRSDIITADFPMDRADINTNTLYKVQYGDYNLPVEFRLKSYESFDTLEEIGPTDVHNNISITAVAERKDGKLDVELYPINRTGYDITSFTKIYSKGYFGKDLRLETDHGIIGYSTPGSYMGLNTKFSFEVSPDEKDTVLKIPYLTIKSHESIRIGLKVPKMGEKLKVDKRVEFKDCTMIITEVEKVSEPGNEYGALKMDLKYENHDKNKVMNSASFTRTNFWGATAGGGYSFKLEEENDVVSSVIFSLEKGEEDKIYLQINNPTYYLLGDYSLSLQQP